MSGPHCREAPGLGFDHGAEIVWAQGASLLETVADGRQIVFRQCFVQIVGGRLGPVHWMSHPQKGTEVVKSE